MATTNYNSRSQRVDIRDRYFKPLQRYGLRDVHCSRELQYFNTPYGSQSLNSPYSSYYQPEENMIYEVSLDKRGLEMVMDDLERIECIRQEEWLRANNPSLQQAWEHYQTILALVK